MAKTPTFDIFCGRYVRADTSMAETSMAEMSEHPEVINLEYSLKLKIKHND